MTFPLSPEVERAIDALVSKVELQIVDDFCSTTDVGVFHDRLVSRLSRLPEAIRALLVVEGEPEQKKEGA